MTGTWGFKFPTASFKFVIKHHKIKIGKTTIKLRRSKNKRFRGWWTFPFHKMTYYVRFTTRGIRVVSMIGKKIVKGKVTTRPRRTHKPKPRPRPKLGKLSLFFSKTLEFSLSDFCCIKYVQGDQTSQPPPGQKIVTALKK